MKYKEISDKIINAYFEVYNKLGIGFLEKIYENAMMIELKKRGLSVNSQIPIEIFYYDNCVGNYIGDILVNEKILVELKAITKLTKNEQSQLLNYLSATKYEVGLLLNFGEEYKIIRKVFDNQFKTYLYKNKTQYKIQDKTDRIIGVFYKVYSVLGYGFQEKVYENALQIEFLQQKIKFHKDYKLSVSYDSEIIGEFSAPFFIEDMIISVICRKEIRSIDEQKLINQLNFTGIQSGLLLNFGKKPQIKHKYKTKSV